MSIVTTDLGLPLRELTETLGGTWHSTPPQSVRSVRIDSRECEDGSLFVALRGSDVDGHDFLSDARDRGAVAAVVERTTSADLPQFVVQDAEAALQALARRYRRNHMSDYVVGITGTCGKTTLKTMLADVLEADYRVGRTPGNFNNHLGVPLTILNEGGGDVLVAEVATNAPGEIGELSRWLQPDMGIITHVGPGHLEGLETVRKVAREKADLLAELPEDGIAFLPEWIRYRGEMVNRSRVLPRSINQGENGSFRIEWDEGDAASTITLNDTTIELDFTGEGLLRDAVLAAAAATVLGVDSVDVKAALEAFDPLPGRGETIEINGTPVIDGTYNANPDSMRTALNRLAEKPGPRLAVLGDMKELGESAPEQHRDLAEFVATIDDLDVVFVGTFESDFRKGLNEFPGDYRGVETVGDVPEIAIDQYGSGLLKASRAIGLDELTTTWTDQQ